MVIYLLKLQDWLTKSPIFLPKNRNNGLVALSPPATKETGAMGCEIESRQGPQWSENSIWAKKFHFFPKFCPKALFDMKISFDFIKLVKNHLHKIHK
jgi:hypothetical protein